VGEHLASGRLVTLLPEWSPSFPGWCLYYPANRHPPTALRLFAAAVRAWSEANLTRHADEHTNADARPDAAANAQPAS
jgi:DNA-binding transcriptional LysR family regulator